jgi:hypothetical protein
MIFVGGADQAVLAAELVVERRHADPTPLRELANLLGFVPDVGNHFASGRENWRLAYYLWSTCFARFRSLDPAP